MSRTRLFWILFAALGLAGLTTAVRLLPEALNLVHDEITMDREAALAAAERLADLKGWSPPAEVRRTAASYGEEDPGVRSFVELEHGGSDAYQALVEGGVYVPSRWTVRLFAPDSIAEAWVEFTPHGRPYGFGLTLADDDPGAGNLDPAAAEALAREIATEWDADLARFELVESATDEAPSGRVDHAFVFRRLGVDLGEGEVRLRVRIAGHRAAGVAHYIEIPEAFRLRYQELRTGNDGIALAASALFLVLFVIMGGGGGVLYLVRRRGLVLRPAFVLGGVVGLALALNGLNTIPLAWMQYDTAVGEGMFLAQLVGGALVMGAVAVPLLGVLYMAAESMTRAAFPGQLQQWRFWSREVARSDTALGVTLTGYLLTGLHLGYVTLFMLGTSRLEGWWSPASNVIQPDLIATWQPWLLAVATNLMAATWEESVFRAIPLAGAALLGARFGRRGLWIGAALVLQAVVFAAGHANYPQQPAYARVVELIPPALMWGFVYLRLGLIPTIFAHFFYNLYLTSIPLFQMSAPGIWVDRVATLAVAAIPLLVVLGARLRFGARAEAPAEARNGAWRPPDDRVEAAAPETASGPAPQGATAVSDPLLRLPLPTRWVLPLGVVLLLATGVVGRERGVPAATATRGEAIELAEAELRQRGFDPGEWEVVADFASERGRAHQWVFEELGGDVYHRVLGDWLVAPRWRVRFVDFERAPEERVEEFTVVVDAQGRPTGFEHTLPDGRPGPELSEDEARARVLGHLADPLGLDAAAFVEVAAESNARPARRDWEFGFRALDVLPDSLGQARLTITLAGDEVVSARRVIEPPESWLREQEARVSPVLLGIPVLLMVLAGGGFVLVVGVRLWSQGALELRLLAGAAGVAFALLAVTWLNGMPETVAAFDPALGWPVQFGGWVFAGVFASAVGAGGLGLAAAVSRAWLEKEGLRSAPVGVGVAAVGAVLLLSALSGRLLAEPSPPSRAFDGIDHFWPPLTPLAGGLLEFVATLTALTLLGAVYRRAGRSTGMKVALQVGVGLLAGSVLALSWTDGPVGAVASTALVVAGIYLFGWLVARVPRVAVEAAGAVTLLGLVTSVVDPSYPGQALGAGLGAVGVLAFTAGLWRSV